MRRPRSDRGIIRIGEPAISLLRAEIAGQNRPAMTDVLRNLATACDKIGIVCPARATVYKLIDTIEVRSYSLNSLPAAAAKALYNLARGSRVPGRQVVFYCLNYGDLDAVCFAASLPWLDLWQALRMRGWRPKSRGLLEAVCRTRRI